MEIFELAIGILLKIIIIVSIVVLVIVCLPKEEGKNYGGKVPKSRNMIYEEKLADPRWREKRERILRRDGYRCSWCGRSDHLQVHHKYYMKYPDGRLAEPWDYPDEKLITLCEDCHRKWHEKHKANVYYRKWGVHYE